MPFTPFHMGAALALKFAAQQRFSLIAFGLAQIAMDIEPLIGMLRGTAVLHGPTHTFLGALVIGLLVAWVSPWVCGFLLRRYNQAVRCLHLPWLTEVAVPPPAAVLSGALAGTLSHVVLDALMHRDMHPLRPFADANPLLGLISHDGVYELCVVLGVAGLAGWLMVKWLRRNA